MILYIINPDLVSNTFKFTIPSSSQPSSNIPTESQRTNATNGAAATTGIVPAAGGATSFHGLPIAKAQEGMYVFTVKVTDRNGDTCSESYNIEVLPNTVALSSDFYAKHSAVGKYSASLLNPVRESLGLKRKLGTIGISNGVNAVNAQEESESETTETIQSGGCVIGTRVLPDAVENTPYYAEIVAAGEAPFVYEIEEGSLPPGLGLVAALDMPVLTIENLTAQRTPAYSFNQTDRFRLTLTNAKPNSKVFFKWIKNGQPWFWSNIKPTTGGWTEYGVTDQDGKWVNEAAYSPEYVGVWQIYAMVDGKISKAIEIQVVAPEVEIATAPPSSLPSAYYNPYAFSSCVNTTHCENTETGETSPLNEIVGGGVGSCDEDERIVWECTYPWDENDPNDKCGKMTFEERTCRDKISELKKPDGSLDMSQIPYSEDGNPPEDVAGSPYAVQQYVGDVNLGPGNLMVMCGYSDQTAAVHCGLSSSGEYCLPDGRGAGWNQRWCAN
jgi:hypothetical protein